MENYTYKRHYHPIKKLEENVENLKLEIRTRNFTHGKLKIKQGELMWAVKKLLSRQKHSRRKK